MMINQKLNRRKWNVTTLSFSFDEMEYLVDVLLKPDDLKTESPYKTVRIFTKLYKKAQTSEMKGYIKRWLNDYTDRKNIETIPAFLKRYKKIRSEKK